MNRNNERRKLHILSFLMICLLSLTGCGEQVCSYCGQERICKEFDLLGTTRYICEDCLNNPSIALSGNVAREYSEIYESGALEYPENSPLSPNALSVSDAIATAVTPQPAVQNPEPVANSSEPAPVNTASEQEAAATETPAPAPQPVDEASHNTESTSSPANEQSTEQTSVSPTTTSTSAATAPEEYINSISQTLQPTGFTLEPMDRTTWRLKNGTTDTNILFTFDSVNADSPLSIEAYDNASSSDYAKAAIYSIINAISSNDYDGLGHDIYNNVIQNGSYRQGNVNFTYVTHTAAEVEKGSPLYALTITK